MRKAFIYKGLDRIRRENDKKTKCTFTWILFVLRTAYICILFGFWAWLFGLVVDCTQDVIKKPIFYALYLIMYARMYAYTTTPPKSPQNKGFTP